jgi:hypothetical protein
MLTSCSGPLSESGVLLHKPLDQVLLHLYAPALDTPALEGPRRLRVCGEPSMKANLMAGALRS